MYFTGSLWGWQIICYLTGTQGHSCSPRCWDSGSWGRAWHAADDTAWGCSAAQLLYTVIIMNPHLDFQTVHWLMCLGSLLWMNDTMTTWRMTGSGGFFNSLLSCHMGLWHHSWCSVLLDFLWLSQWVLVQTAICITRLKISVFTID
jgi:hypothetical protein